MLKFMLHMRTQVPCLVSKVDARPCEEPHGFEAKTVLDTRVCALGKKSSDDVDFVTGAGVI